MVVVFENGRIQLVALPSTGLLSAPITGTIAARRGELTGFYSCGGRPSTIVQAWSIASLAWVALGMGLAEYVLPVAKHEQLGLDLGLEKTQQLAAERRPVEWVSIEDWRIFLPTVSAEGTEFIAPQVLEMRVANCYTSGVLSVLHSRITSGSCAKRFVSQWMGYEKSSKNGT